MNSHLDHIMNSSLALMPVAAMATTFAVGHKDIFRYVYEMDARFHHHQKACVIIVFKIKEMNRVYYYLIPRLKEMNRSFSDVEDFSIFARFDSLDEMIDHIKEKNRYGYDVDNGLFYTSKGSFRTNVLFPKIPLEFNREECKKILEAIPENNPLHWATSFSPAISTAARTTDTAGK